MPEYYKRKRVKSTKAMFNHWTDKPLVNNLSWGQSKTCFSVLLTPKKMCLIFHALIIYFSISSSGAIKVIRSENNIDKFNQYGLAEVLDSSLRKYFNNKGARINNPLPGLKTSSPYVPGFIFISFQQRSLEISSGTQSSPQSPIPFSS